MTLTQAIEDFTLSLRANARSPGTIDCYRRDLLSLVAWTGDLQASNLTPGLVQGFLVSDAAQLKADGTRKSQVTINRSKATIRAFGAWLEDMELVKRNPARAILLKRVDRKSPSYLEDHERKRLLREVAARKGEAARRDRVMLELLLGTGIRVAELVGLDLDQVDLDQKRITITAKGGRTETRFLSSDLRRLLRAFLRTRQRDTSESQALFLSNRNTRISVRQVQTRFKLWLSWAGITRDDLTVHSLRHTFGTRLYRKTQDLVLVGKALGHRTSEATLIYVHQDDDALEDALEAM